MSVQRPRAGAVDDRRGVALMLVLWLLLVLGMASLQILAEVRSRVDEASLLRSRTVARYAAESGVVAASTLLDDMVRGAASPGEQALVFGEYQQTVAAWGEQRIGSGRYQVLVVDLNSRIDLNRSRTSVLKGLLGQFVSASEAEGLVRALRGSGEAYEAVTPPAEPDSAFSGPGAATRPLRHLEELALVPGFGDSLTAAIAPYVTVEGDGRINVNTAPLPVLAAVPEIGEVAARSLLATRDRGGPLASALAVYSALAEISRGAPSSRMPGLLTTPRRVLVVSRGWEDGRAYTHEVQAVFDVFTSSLVSGSRVRPRAWMERGR